VQVILSKIVFVLSALVFCSSVRVLKCSEADSPVNARLIRSVHNVVFNDTA
jgi:hypothetical protein